MRKAIGGLTSIIESELETDLFGPSLFVFCGRSRRILKMIYWDETGFALWNKKLEKNRFSWLKDRDEKSTSIKADMLILLLQGGNITKHKKLKYERVS